MAKKKLFLYLNIYLSQIYTIYLTIYVSEDDKYGETS